MNHEQTETLRAELAAVRTKYQFFIDNNTAMSTFAVFVVKDLDRLTALLPLPLHATHQPS